MPSLKDTVKSLALDAAKMNQVCLYDLYMHRDRFQIFIDRENPAAATPGRDASDLDKGLSSKASTEDFSGARPAADRIAADRISADRISADGAATNPQAFATVLEARKAASALPAAPKGDLSAGDFSEGGVPSGDFSAEPLLRKTRGAAGKARKKRGGNEDKEASKAATAELFAESDKKSPLTTEAGPKEKESGRQKNRAIRIEDCERVSRSLSFLIQAQIPDFFKKWNLEISSPGIERKLREKWHFQEALGREVKITALSPGRGNCGKTGEKFKAFSFSGKLISCQEDKLTREDILTLKKNKILWKIPYNQIKQARVVFLLPHPPKTVKKAEQK